MAHSTWIALAVMSLFLVYITARGELPQYLATVLGPYPAPETGGTGGAGSPGGGGTGVGQALSGVAGLAKQAGNLFGGSGEGFGEGDYGGGGDLVN